LREGDFEGEEWKPKENRKTGRYGHEKCGGLSTKGCQTTEALGGKVKEPNIKRGRHLAYDMLYSVRQAKKSWDTECGSGKGIASQC